MIIISSKTLMMKTSDTRVLLVMMNTVYVFEISSYIILYLFTVNKKVSSLFWTVLLSSWKGSVVFEVIYVCRLSYKNLIFCNFYELYPFPISPKESGSSPVISVTYFGLLLILSIKFNPDLSTLSLLQDSPPLNSPPQWHWIRSGFKIRDLIYEVLVNMKFN